jgi:hypothetical protein
MITVRFQNGQAVQYNSGNYVARSQWGYSDIYTKKDGDWLVQVPNACIIEVVTPCRVYNGMTQEADRRIEELTKEIRALKRKINK